MSFKFLIALTLVLGLVQGQAKLELIGRLRDFSNWDSGQPEKHPDFNNRNGGEKEIVKIDLGVDTKPVFNSDKMPAVTQVESKDTFDQWYRDVDGVNIPFDYTLVLTDDGHGIYTYENSEFFPLDGQGYKNDNNGHNFGFTLEIHTVFTYKKGQTFYFRGDDDLWVFINKKRVIDLGGIHGAEEAGVDLSTLELKEGNDYNLDIFFAERHVSASNFKIQTSIQLKPSCSAPEIYNAQKNKCEGCDLPEVYLASTGACGQCTGKTVYNSKTFACEECAAGTIFDEKKGCVPCSDGLVYLSASKSCGTCSGPKIYDPVAYTCDTCPGFYNWDGTCVPSCQKDLQGQQGGIPICNFPCRKTQIYHVITNKCVCECKQPFTKVVVNGYKICDIDEPQPL